VAGRAKVGSDDRSQAPQKEENQDSKQNERPDEFQNSSKVARIAVQTAIWGAVVYIQAPSQSAQTPLATATQAVEHSQSSASKTASWCV
jgi:hypothetical protein